MSHRRTGGVVVRAGSNGRRVFAIRFRAYGKRRYLSLGSNFDGWTRAKAEAELANVLADVRRGIWKPPECRTRPVPVAEAPLFSDFAAEWFRGIHLEGLRPTTLADYDWQLNLHLNPFFGAYRLSDITIAEVDRYRQAKVAEGAISPTSINKTIGRLAQILDVAIEREIVNRNPARGRRRRLKQRRPLRTYLDRAQQIASLLEAAGELDQEARADHKATPRRTVLAVLTLAGLRIGEALDLRWRAVDIGGSRLRVGASKTEAGTRTVDLLPALVAELSAHRARSRYRGLEDYVFPTHAGKRQNPSNIRNRLLARSIERANVYLAARDQSPLPEGLTPHSLRRTYISVLLAIGNEVPYVMRQVGHADPKVTLGIYAQVMYRGEGERERLQKLVNEPLGTAGH